MGYLLNRQNLLSDVWSFVSSLAAHSSFGCHAHEAWRVAPLFTKLTKKPKVLLIGIAKINDKFIFLHFLSVATGSANLCYGNRELHSLRRGHVAPGFPD